VEQPVSAMAMATRARVPTLPIRQAAGGRRFSLRSYIRATLCTPITIAPIPTTAAPWYAMSMSQEIRGRRLLPA
jgi:hypothetical protein